MYRLTYGTLYTLEEMKADPKLKKNLVESNQHDDVDNFLETDVTDLVYEFEALGFLNVKIYYDLSCSQGSGCCFEFTEVDILKLVRKYKSLNKSCRKLKFLFKKYNRKGWVNKFAPYTISTIRNSLANRYCHSNTRNMEFDFENLAFNNLFDSVEVQENLLEFKNEMRKVYYDLCNHIQDRLQKSLEYYESADFIIEELESVYPGMLYRDSGKIAGIAEYDLKQDSKNTEFQKSLDNAIQSKDSFVVIKGEAEGNKVLAKTNSEAYDFISVKDCEFNKAIIFNNKEEAHNFIIETFTDYCVTPIETVFSKENT